MFRYCLPGVLVFVLLFCLPISAQVAPRVTAAPASPAALDDVDPVVEFMRPLTMWEQVCGFAPWHWPD